MVLDVPNLAGVTSDESRPKRKLEARVQWGIRAGDGEVRSHEEGNARNLRPMVLGRRFYTFSARLFSMKRSILCFSIGWLLLIAAHAAPVIFIVRHAEKATTGGNDPHLSNAGQKRAEALARILRDSQIAGVFVTEFKRTQETAAPTAKAAQLSPTVISATDTNALVEKLHALDGNALVVGHGNTIPNLLRTLGIPGQLSIPDDDYSEIFVVSLREGPQLLRLHYSF